MNKYIIFLEIGQFPSEIQKCTKSTTTKGSKADQYILREQSALLLFAYRDIHTLINQNKKQDKYGKLRNE